MGGGERLFGNCANQKGRNVLTRQNFEACARLFFIEYDWIMTHDSKKKQHTSIKLYGVRNDHIWGQHKTVRTNERISAGITFSLDTNILYRGGAGENTAVHAGLGKRMMPRLC